MPFRALGTLLGIDFRIVERYVNGKQVPTILTAHKIKKAAKGKVDYEDWIDDTAENKSN